MKRWAALLCSVALAPLAWGADAEWPEWPRPWTVNVSGEWQITGCPQGVRMLEVRQNGHHLAVNQNPAQPLRLNGTVTGHDVVFSIANAQALDCLPDARELRFVGAASGARIVGELRAVDDEAKHAAITISLRRELMLSFDDGPLPGKTDRVLDALRSLPAQDGQSVRAAFFTVGDAPSSFWEGRAYYAPYEIWTHKGSMRTHPELIERMRAEGHAVGNHTAHHAWFRWPRFSEENVVADELRAWEAALPAAPSERLFRPPYLITTDAVLAAARDTGYQVVLGDTVGDAAPWAGVNAVEWKALQIMETRDGSMPALLIFHDIFPATYEHLEEIVARLSAKGYRLVNFDTQRLDAKTLIRPQ